MQLTIWATNHAESGVFPGGGESPAPQTFSLRIAEMYLEETPPKEAGTKEKHRIRKAPKFLDIP